MFLVASVVNTDGVPQSATGVGVTKADAWRRHDAERAERAVAFGLPPEPLVGWAAGRDSEDAVAQRAEAELAERWIAGLWWAGHVACAEPDADATAAFASMAAQCTRDVPRVDEGLIALPFANRPPAFVAWSADAQAHGLCFGLGQSADRARAELYQMEFGLALAVRRDAAGQNCDHARAVLARARGLSLADVQDRLTPVDQELRNWPGKTRIQRYVENGHRVARATQSGLMPGPKTRWPLYV